MARYNRINLDGKSDTKAGLVTAITLPGTFLRYNAGTAKFVAATSATLLQKYYVANGFAESVSAADAIPADGSVNAEVLSSNRELALLVAASQTVVIDSPLTITAAGQVKVATGVEVVVAFASEALTTGAGVTNLIKAVMA